MKKAVYEAPAAEVVVFDERDLLELTIGGDPEGGEPVNKNWGDW